MTILVQRGSMLLGVLFLVSCALTPISPCEKNTVNANGVPCWVNHKPENGVVLSMHGHVDPSKTRHILFNKALVELAANIQGVDVSEDTIVKKHTKVEQNDYVTSNAQVISLATVTLRNGGVSLKAKVKAEWKNPTSRKLYLWVVPVN